MPAAPRPELQGLMTRLADGERAAFAPLYAALWPVVRSFCRRGLGSAADAEDAAQQALLNVFARAGEFDPSRDAVAWVLGIAAWECRSTLRRRTRRREELLPAAEPAGLGGTSAAAPHAEDDLVRRDLLAAAADLVGTLRADDIATLEAALDGDPEGRAGLAPATFRKRVERAVTRLRTAWRSRHGVL